MLDLTESGASQTLVTRHPTRSRPTNRTDRSPVGLTYSRRGRGHRCRREGRRAHQVARPVHVPARGRGRRRRLRWPLRPRSAPALRSRCSSSPPTASARSPTIARMMERYDTIGLDVVAMSVDDIAVQGAEPLSFLDYLSVGKVVPETVEEIVSGVAEGCRQAGAALSGGEISEHPDLMEPGEFDLVGFAVGVVERAEILPRGVRRRVTRSSASGARVFAATATRSPGARCSNDAVARSTSPAWDGASPLTRRGAAHPERHLRTRSMAELRRARRRCTGSRTSPAAASPATWCGRCLITATAVVHRGTWDEPRIFTEIQAAGDVSDDEMEQVFNLGLGMLAVVPTGEVLARWTPCTERGSGRVDGRRDRRRATEACTSTGASRASESSARLLEPPGRHPRAPSARGTRHVARVAPPRRPDPVRQVPLRELRVADPGPAVAPGALDDAAVPRLRAPRSENSAFLPVGDRSVTGPAS